MERTREKHQEETVKIRHILREHGSGKRLPVGEKEEDQNERKAKNQVYGCIAGLRR